MNLRERGITVGDLLIIVVIISSLFIIKYVKNDKEKSISENKIGDYNILLFNN